jgi:hypothetical protein
MLERALSFGMVDGLVAFQEFASKPTGLWEVLIQSKIDESHEIVDESHGRPVSEQFSGLVRDFLLVSRAAIRLLASTNSRMTALQHAKETER